MGEAGRIFLASGSKVGDEDCFGDALNALFSPDEGEAVASNADEAADKSRRGQFCSSITSKEAEVGVALDAELQDLSFLESLPSVFFFFCTRFLRLREDLSFIILNY